MSRSSAAVTVVNALPTGVGCAIGIQRFVTASAELSPDRSFSVDCTPTEAATPLLTASVRAALVRFGMGDERHASIDLRSEIPIGKGLKSSSAVSTAIIRAVARAGGLNPPALEVARLAAEVGRAVGVSATGALDDALAGLRPGFQITDNREEVLLAEGMPESGWTAVVYVPHGVHPPAPSLRSDFEAAAPEGRRIAEAALAGRYAEAMRLNSELVEHILGYEYAELRSRLTAAGAEGVGVSGLGPALAALVPRDRAAEVLACLPSDSSDRFTVALTSGDAP
ncbi:MAG: shikimate kinase [Thermoplasmata archaeon]|nr:shikimate kinase [Thermoplasmata archaeon]